MSLYLCVDCGGSKTSAVISDANGKILGRGLGGPSNFAYLTLEQFVSSVTGAVNSALAECPSVGGQSFRLPVSGEAPFAAAWFGVSGVDSPSAVAEITPALSQLLGIPEGPRLSVANDTCLLAAPLRMHPDIATAVTVIAGTGSIVVSYKEVNNQLEQLGRIGGWGWILGDEGGGFSVGREAIRQILWDHDKSTAGGPPLPESHLTKEVLKMFGISDIMEILPIIHLPDPVPSQVSKPNAPAPLFMPKEKRLSSLSPLVFDAAFKHNDPLALRILRISASYLTDEICVLLSNGTDDAAGVKAAESVLCFGGSLVGIEVYRKIILDALAERGHTFKYVEYVDDAAATGAIGLSASFRAMSNGVH